MADVTAATDGELIERHDTTVHQSPAGTAVRLWRVGRKVGRTIYEQQGDRPSDNDVLIGVMDTPELADLVVLAVNNLTGA